MKSFARVAPGGSAPGRRRWSGAGPSASPGRLREVPLLRTHVSVCVRRRPPRRFDWTVIRVPGTTARSRGAARGPHWRRRRAPPGRRSPRSVVAVISCRSPGSSSCLRCRAHRSGRSPRRSGNGRARHLAAPYCPSCQLHAAGGARRLDLASIVAVVTSLSEIWIPTSLATDCRSAIEPSVYDMPPGYMSVNLERLAGLEPAPHWSGGASGRGAAGDAAGTIFQPCGN